MAAALDAGQGRRRFRGTTPGASSAQQSERWRDHDRRGLLEDHPRISPGSRWKGRRLVFGRDLVRRISRRSMLQALAGQAFLVRAVSGQTSATTATTVRRMPKPLAPGAVTHDWASFLGPTHNGVSTETKLSRTMPPPLVWEFDKGTSYASPAVAGGRLVFIHRMGNEEIVECLHPETGSSFWQVRYPTKFEDRYGYNNGPLFFNDTATTEIYTMGAEGKLHCLELGSGKVAWMRDLRVDYKVRQDFFGTASTPLGEGRLLIVNVGQPGVT